MVDFDFFKRLQKSVLDFKKTLQNFEGGENSFFDSIVYGLMSKKNRRKRKTKKRKS